jgi:hypothetical protein
MAVSGAQETSPGPRDLSLSIPSGDQCESNGGNEKRNDESPFECPAALVRIDAEEQLDPLPGDEGKYCEPGSYHCQGHLDPESNSRVPHYQPPFFQSDTYAVRRVRETFMCLTETVIRV